MKAQFIWMPGHGVCEVVNISKRTVNGDEFQAYTSLSSGATLMAGAGCGVAMPSKADVIRALLSPAKPQLVTTWNRRFREHNDKLRSDNPLAVIEVYHELRSLERDKELSFGERRMLDKAAQLTEQLRQYSE